MKNLRLQLLRKWHGPQNYNSGEIVHHGHPSIKSICLNQQMCQNLLALNVPLRYKMALGFAKLENSLKEGGSICL